MIFSVGDVQEAVVVFSLFVHFTHQGVTCENVSSIDEQIKGVALWHLDTSADDVAELVGGQVRWGEELASLVAWKFWGGCSLTNNGEMVWILHADVIGLFLSLLEAGDFILKILLDVRFL